MTRKSKAAKSWQAKLQRPLIAVTNSIGVKFWRLRLVNEAFRERRPHASFRPTPRRDYVRTLKLPGYWSFTIHVFRTLWQFRKLVGGLLLLYAVLYGLLVGLASQDTFASLREALGEVGSVVAGETGSLTDAGLLLLAGSAGGFNAVQSEAGQIYAVLLGFMVWLAMVWLLRALLAGNRPRLRDALYNSGAPILPSILTGMALVVQLLPAAIGVIVISSAITTGFISQGVGGMLVTAGALLLILLSVFWATSTLFALVLVTLPGMYPMRALKLAGDIVTGRRLRILLRWVWMFALLFVFWIFVMVPTVLFDGWVKGAWPAIDWIPIVPLVLLVVSAVGIGFSASYVYLLYRKVVDEDAATS